MRDEVVKGPPVVTEPYGPRSELGKTTKALAAAALAEPGEWFSIPVGDNRNNFYTYVYRYIGAAISEVQITGGRVWVRVKEKN